MEFILNYGFAWMAMGLTVILSVIYMTRKRIKNASNKKTWVKLNLKLRKFHKELGVLLILVGLVHGMNSSFDVLSFNLGTLAWIMSIILGLNWLFRIQLSKSIQWVKIHRFLTVAFVITLFLHLNEVGGVQIISILTNPDSVETVTTLDPGTVTESGALIYGTFSDGTYRGSATGYSTGLSVEVVISDNTITSITIISHHERNSQFYAKAFNKVPSDIIDSQSLDVDTVAGATFSSVGIINAVNDALSQALVSGTLPSDLPLPTKRSH